MLFYLLFLIMSVVGSVFIGSIITASIMSVLGKKYEFQLATFFIWGLVFLFLAFITRWAYVG